MNSDAAIRGRLPLGPGNCMPDRKPFRCGNTFTAATTLFREMDMRFWVQKAEAELIESP